MAEWLFIFLLFPVMPQEEQNLKQLCNSYNELNSAIRDQRMEKQQSVKQWQHFMNRLQEKSRIYVDTGKTQWVFPLRGYTAAATGGKNGNGYMAAGYDYFDGNRHKGHAAHDIFIADRNQDNLDDHSGKPVDVLAVLSGIVVATDSSWKKGSALRGGNYVYVYNPHWSVMVYYAHNARLLVKPGDVVKAGQKIAEVGRTGLNAAQKRSPTHLHITSFHVTGTGPLPWDCYPQLKQARLIK